MELSGWSCNRGSPPIVLTVTLAWVGVVVVEVLVLNI